MLFRSAKARRSASVVQPAWACMSPSTAAYCAGAVTTVTASKFFAALRSIDGPPMSMFSIASARLQSARAIAVGYKNSMFGVSNIAGYQRHFNAIRGFAGSGVGGWHDAIADVIGLELDVANKVSSVPTPSPNLPDIVGKMTMAARLINANIGCRVVDVSWGGFDTHAGELAAELRAAGISVERSTDKKLKRALEVANKIGARFALIIGDDEVNSGQYALKNLATGEQVKLSRAELSGRVQQQ